MPLVAVAPFWSLMFEAHPARARSRPPLEGARERGWFRKPYQIGRFVYRKLLPAQVVERLLVAQPVKDLFERYSLRFQLPKKRLSALPFARFQPLAILTSGTGPEIL